MKYYQYDGSRYSCNFCGRTFKTAAAVQGHQPHCKVRKKKPPTTLQVPEESTAFLNDYEAGKVPQSLTDFCAGSASKPERSLSASKRTNSSARNWQPPAVNTAEELLEKTDFIRRTYRIEQAVDYLLGQQAKQSRYIFNDLTHAAPQVGSVWKAFVNFVKAHPILVLGLASGCVVVGYRIGKAAGSQGGGERSSEAGQERKKLPNPDVNKLAGKVIDKGISKVLDKIF